MISLKSIAEAEEIIKILHAVNTEYSSKLSYYTASQGGLTLAVCCAELAKSGKIVELTAVDDKCNDEIMRTLLCYVLDVFASYGIENAVFCPLDDFVARSLGFTQSHTGLTLRLN